MQHETKKRLAWKGAVAAAFFIAPHAHATAWCPTASDNTISCSGCSRELTCEVNDMTLYITGDNVVLDGMGHASFWAPYNAVQVEGAGATIKNLSIYGAGSDAILFLYSPTASNLVATVDNVYVSNVNGSGVEKDRSQPLVVKNSKIYYAGKSGVLAIYSNQNKMNLIGNTISGAGLYGFFSSGANNSLISGNTVTNTNGGNSAIGVGAQVATNVIIEKNTVNNNQGRGLYVASVNSGTVRYNQGSGNGWYDCYEQHQAGTTITAYGNVFPKRTGAGCAP